MEYPAETGDRKWGGLLLIKGKLRSGLSRHSYRFHTVYFVLKWNMALECGLREFGMVSIRAKQSIALSTFLLCLCA